MSYARIIVLTSLAMLAFAGNSLLCRAALKDVNIDPTSFTTIRLVSGALVLWLAVRVVRSSSAGQGNALSAFTLLVYAICFSFAYVSLPTATGALLLFAAVQATMISYGIWTGERFLRLQFIGLVLAAGGLVGLLLPGISTPPLFGSLLMLVAGVSWGVYSLRGKFSGDPIKVTAGNFMRAGLIAACMSLLMRKGIFLNQAGFWYAVASGVFASGMGYAIWYTILPALKASSAASLQLSVPAIAAFGGVIFLGETITLRLVLTSAAILGGIALVLLGKAPAPQAPKQQSSLEANS